tara:strand:+ start:2888 stop:3307 length:420 start_codon:yes stop_codon:yes gene_type:complete
MSGIEWASTPQSLVVIVMVLVAIFASATWKNAKGEGWGMIIFLGSLIVGFNLSVSFAVWFLDWLGGTFGGMSTLIDSAGAFGDGFGLIAVIIVLGVVSYIMRTIKFDTVRLASLGALYGILLRLFLDFMYFLITSEILG